MTSIRKKRIPLAPSKCYSKSKREKMCNNTVEWPQCFIILLPAHGYSMFIDVILATTHIYIIKLSILYLTLQGYVIMMIWWCSRDMTLIISRFYQLTLTLWSRFSYELRSATIFSDFHSSHFPPVHTQFVWGFFVSPKISPLYLQIFIVAIFHRQRSNFWRSFIFHINKEYQIQRFIPEFLCIVFQRQVT